MKKVVRMLGLCALVALAFTSCKKNETNGKVTFKASINQSVNERTYMDGIGDVRWSAGDNIYVFNEDGGYISCDLKDSEKDKKSASFEGDGTFLANITTENSYSSFYPVQPTTVGSTVSLVIPNEQTYVPGTFATRLYPMYAVNDAAKNFSFDSDAGLLAIAVTKKTEDSPAGFDRIHIEATGSELVGTMVYDYNYPITKITDTTATFSVNSPSDYVDLLCDPTIVVLKSEPRWYNIVLLPGTYTITVTLYNGLTPIELTSGDSNALQGESFTLRNVVINPERRTVAPIILID